MRYHDITKDDMLNGEGLRVVLWVSGCAHGCRGCQNPLTWDPDSGLEFDEEAERELFALLSRDYISGLTLSGGDPLFPGNRAEVCALLKEVRERFPEKDVWLYTGYTAEEVMDWEGLGLVDVLVDGRYEEEKKSPGIPWVGSSNQRVIDVRETLKARRVVVRNEGIL